MQGQLAQAQSSLNSLQSNYDSLQSDYNSVSAQLDDIHAVFPPEEFANSDDLRSTMKRAGVQGAPEIWYGEDIEHT